MVERVPEFSGTRPEPDLMKQNIKFGVKKCMIPDKIPDFLGTRIRLFGIPNRPDPNPTFYYPIYSIPDFLLPVPPLVKMYDCIFIFSSDFNLSIKIIIWFQVEKNDIFADCASVTADLHLVQTIHMG